MQIKVHNTQGEEISRVKVDNSVFKIEPNEDVVHRAILAERVNSRQGSHSTKTRSEVRGGGRKPWRQKGRGVARAGTIRSPLWRGGGVTFGPKPHDYHYKLPKKMKRLARRSVLSQKIVDKEIYVMDKLELTKASTKSFREVLRNLNIADKKVTFCPAELNKNLRLSARNLPNVTVVPAVQLSTYNMIDCDILLFDKEGIKQLNKQLVIN
ncbi:MAG: 50S ribosomal protein L4 [Candidatus Marinimicrobia bacterium]|nr:50S ribosomal protein L4 [Candidatus Neomarinimicrobiota bacterium]